MDDELKKKLDENEGECLRVEAFGLGVRKVQRKGKKKDEVVLREEGDGKKSKWKWVEKERSNWRKGILVPPLLE